MAELFFARSSIWSSIDVEHEEIKRLVKSHVKEIQDTWNSISNIYSRYDESGWVEEYLWKPFIHEVYFKALPYPVFQLLQSRVGNDLDLFTDSLGRTALHVTTSQLASKSWDSDDWATTLKLTDKALLNATDKFGNTTLHIACVVCSRESERVDRQLKVIRALLKSDIKANIRNGYGLLAIEYAILGNRTDILRIFRDIRGIEISGIVSAIDDAQMALKKARGIVQANMAGTEGLDQSTEDSGPDT
ncbi:hypothetical protein GQX73_g428 [Xylaria multiplex]|uniref:Uncharacterized protein n=1 Tax=Xylaria multiplex TaxID=323545 RepID=A0A7C8J8D4_9PEZI|nr:hypothetical protein GQX73_g428 [Xylaria multiplex]